MKVVLAGSGSVGRYMAERLNESGHTVTVIDTNLEPLNRLSTTPGIAVVRGDACDVGVLERGGAADADVVAAVTGDDEDNLVISLLAKQEFGVPRVIGRVNNPANEWLFDSMWGVDVSVSTPHLLTALVEEAVSVGSFVRLMTFKGGTAKLAEVTLAEASPAVGREIAALGLPQRVDDRCSPSIRRPRRTPWRHDPPRRR